MNIIIKEDKLLLLKESSDEVTFFKFFTEVKNFLKDLLEDPIGANPSGFFASHGINKSLLLNKMLDKDIIKKKENIDEPNDADGKMKSRHYLQYSVPKKDFENKIKRLYNYFFENGEKNDIKESFISDKSLSDFEKAFTPISGKEILKSGVEVVKGIVYPDKFYREG